MNVIDRLLGELLIGKKTVTVSPEKAQQIELVKQLDLLAELRAQEERLLKPYEARRQKLQLDQATALGDLPDKIEQIEKRCKGLCVEVGKSVFGSTLKAEFVTGRKNVDAERLIGWSVDHPEVSQFISDGQATCRIKGITPKEQKSLATAAN